MTKNAANESKVEIDVYKLPMGWYWCVKGCPIGGGPFGPFVTAEEARQDASKGIR